MTRLARIVVPGLPHHITQRGIRGNDVFRTEDDRAFYLANLRIYADKHGVRIWSYCLMTNHVHFVAVPLREDSLGKTFHDAHSVYCMRFNQLNDLFGNLFAGRFYSVVMDDAHTWNAIRYVERNPVRAFMVDHAADYRWSSARSHCRRVHDPLLSNDLPLLTEIGNWSDWLSEEDEEFTLALRKSTRTGRPCGDGPFLQKIEKLVGRSLAPKRRGPKPRRE